ncbi:unnamed protein product [Closterium sp. Naga37s-1]|nr:unnamed protein product [Closterium sp. Naga37s-1]
MDRSSLLPQTAARPRTAFAYVPLALTLGLFTFLFFSRLAYESRDAGSSVDGRDEDGLSCGFLPKLFSLVSNESLALHLRELTAKPHIAGTPENFETARYVKEKFESYGLRAHYADYPVLLSYPLRQSLRLVRPVVHNFSLREEPVHGDPFSASRAATDPFNAYSGSGRVGGKASGRVSGKGAGEEEAEGEGAGEAEGAAVVYANYGRMEDFEELVAAIGEEQVKGAVALIRYGKTFRGDKGDPATPGWPSHPGGERLSDEETAKRLPRIPVLPVGYSVAGSIMAHMGGRAVPEEWRGGMDGVEYVFGPGPAAVDMEVQMNATVTNGRIICSHPQRLLLSIFTSVSSLILHTPAFVCLPALPISCPDPQMNATVTTIRNVIGVLPGSHQPDRWRVRLATWQHMVGRLAARLCLPAGMPRSTDLGSTEWVEDNVPVLATAAMAYINVDVALGSTEWAEDNAPVLATAAMAYINVDVAVWGGGRVLQYKCHFFPHAHALPYVRLTLQLGSTEWAEDNAPVLATAAMAYINVDVAVGGGGFHASSTPQLDDLIRDVSSQVGMLMSAATCADDIETCGGLAENLWPVLTVQLASRYWRGGRLSTTRQSLR